MIRAEAFIDRARDYGYAFYAGVPCSFLTPFINRVIDSDDLTYLSAANEGDAVALAAGQALAGQRAVAMMQNSGLGNAVSPLTSLTWVFHLPVLLIVTWRGAPGVADEPQHALMGEITPAMLETIDVAWELFPVEAERIDAALARAEAHQAQTGRAYALVMQKNTVEPAALENRAEPGHSPGPQPFEPAAAGTTPPASRSAALARLVAATDVDRTVVIASTGYAGRALYALADRANQFYMVGSMGCAAPLGLGLSLACAGVRVVVVDGDGAALMRLGALATVGAYAPPNFVHLLLDNHVHESTGSQATVSAGLSFAAVAAACGYPRVFESADPAVIERALAAGTGPVFAQLQTAPGVPEGGLPRPEQSPVAVRDRLMAHIGARRQPS